MSARNPYEIRCEAERIIGEDRVPTDVLEQLIVAHGGSATPIDLSFYDRRRQPFGHLPIPEAGEFMVGGYSDGGLDGSGEFKITLIDLEPGQDKHRRLHPHLEVFGDAAGSLRAAIEAGLLDQLEPVAHRDEFSRRLLNIGFRDVSAYPIGSNVPGHP